MVVRSQPEFKGSILSKYLSNFGSCRIMLTLDLTQPRGMSWGESLDKNHKFLHIICSKGVFLARVLHTAEMFVAAVLPQALLYHLIKSENMAKGRPSNYIGTLSDACCCEASEHAFLGRGPPPHLHTRMGRACRARNGECLLPITY